MTRLAIPLLVLLVFVGCRSAEQDRAAVASAIEAGNEQTAEEVLREALERHPEDPLLLVQAAEFYLRPYDGEYYRPRLALHYAMRADRAANYASEEVGRTLMRAYRATGGIQGTEQGRALIARGLKQVGHPDALAPQRITPSDPDLLDPTLANVLEQKRRDLRRAEGFTPCDQGLVHVPAGNYPAPRGDGEVLVDAFCVEKPPMDGIGQIGVTAADRGAVCRSLGRRPCTPPEVDVACGALRSVVGRHVACEDERVVRCCDAPELL